MKAKIQKLIQFYEENPRTEQDLETIAVLRELEKIYSAARDMINAKTNQASQAAYSELYDIFRGKREG